MKRPLILVAILAALFSFGVASAQEESPVSRGGQLYDKWWSVTGSPAPTTDQPLWATQSTNTRAGEETWRCKECHGWDYLGQDGAYGSGSHKTGFPGLLAVAETKSVEDLVAALKGAGNANHDFSAVLDEAALSDLANFVKTGTLDPRQYIDYATKTAKNADVALGKAGWEAVCSDCHGPDGTDLNFGSDKEPEFVGTVAVDNPQEFLHKVRVGQPGSDPRMPAAIDNNWSTQDVLNVMAYAQTLPTGMPAAVSQTAAAPKSLPTTGGAGPLSAVGAGVTGLLALAALARAIWRR